MLHSFQFRMMGIDPGEGAGTMHDTIVIINRRGAEKRGISRFA